MKYFLVFLYLLMGYVPFILPYGALDSVYPEMLYMSGVQLLITLTLIIFHKNFEDSEKNIFKSPLIQLVILFLCWTLISIIFSFNRSEALIEWFKFYLFFSSLINISIIYKLIDNKNIFYILISSLLSFETFYVFKKFLNAYDFYNPPGRIYEFVGLTSNLNVTAYSILIKLVLVYYLFIITKKKITNFFLFIIITTSTFTLFVISSRSSIITLLLLQVLLVLISIISLRRRKIDLKLFKKTILVVLVSFFSFIIHNVLYINSENSSSIQRLSSFDMEDTRSSTNFRIGFYKDAVECFINNPFLGVGVGNWKIFSIKYGSERIREYQVPYHAHNDFLQTFAENGLIGGIIYLLLFVIVFFYLLKKILKESKNKSLILNISLIFGLLVFVADSLFNFPRARAINMVNLIYLLSFYIVNVESTRINLFSKKVLKIKKIIFSILAIASAVIFYKLYNNSKQQVILVQDYNYTRFFNRDLKYIETINDKFPSLSHTAMPLTNVKANYYSFQGQNEKAKELFRKGNIYNPFLGDSDIGLARIFYNEKNYDSAYFYSKKAYKKLPFNQLHIALLQDVLLKLDDKNYLLEAREIFEKVRKDRAQIIWENHLLLEINYTPVDSFNQNQRDLVKQALKIFPNSKKLLTAEKLLNNSSETLLLADDYDIEASKFFSEQKYFEAIKNWEKLKTLVKNEDSYYLNIAQAFIQLKNYDAAINELNEIIDLGIQDNDGKLEFLKASALYEKKMFLEACKFFKISSNMGYILSTEVLKKMKCR